MSSVILGIRDSLPCWIDKRIAVAACCLLLAFALVASAVQSTKRPVAEPSQPVQVASAPAAPKAPVEVPGLIRVTRALMPYDAAKLALADAQQFKQEDAQFFRYIFIPYDPAVYTPTVNFIVNAALSQSGVIQYGYQVHPQLIRYDLRFLAPDINDLQNLIDTYEELAFDPYFHEFVEVLDVVDDSREVAVDALKVFLADADKVNSVSQALTNVLDAIKALEDFLGKNSPDKETEQKWRDALKLAKLREDLAKFPRLNATGLQEFIAIADKRIASEAQSVEFAAKLKALRDSVDALLKAPVPRQNAKVILVGDLRIARLQEELSRNRGFDVAFLQQFVKDADKAIAAAKDEVIAKDLKSLRDAVDRLAQDGGDIAKVEVKSRRSGQGALGVNEEIPIPARHAGEAFEILTELVQSDASIVRADYFIIRAYASIDIGHGAGLIYQFYNVKAGLNGLTDFDQLLLDLGVSLEEIAKQRSDANAAMFYSGVTGRTRKVIAVPSLSIAPTRGTGLIVYTQDPSDEQVAAANEPVRNLIAFTFAAQEFIYEGKNGLLRWDLFNAAGLRQNSAPDNVVVDSKCPNPYTKRLYSGTSCLRCHGPNGGHMSVANDIRRLTAGGIDILDDLASGAGLQDQIDRLVGQYNYDFEKPLQRSRDDFGEATFRATAGVRVGNSIKTFQGMTVAVLADAVSKVHLDYAYRNVTPKIALSELGYVVEDDGKALELLRQVAADFPPDEFGITILDPTISAIKLGIPVPRTLYENVYFDLALRSVLTAKLITQGEVSAKKLDAITAVRKQTVTSAFVAKRRLDRKKVQMSIPKLHPNFAKPRPRTTAKGETKFRASEAAKKPEAEKKQ